MSTKKEKRRRGYYSISNRLRLMYSNFVKGSAYNRHLVPTEKLYFAIIKKLFELIFHEIILNGYEFRFRKLGRFSCVKYLPSIRETEDGKILTTKRVDWKNTFKARYETGNRTLKVYFDNETTGGFIYKIIWIKAFTPFTNGTFYRFSLSRPLRAIFNSYIQSEDVLATLIDIKI